MKRVAVLGGGLQGACVALEFAGRGVSVDLYDKNEQCLSQASAQNEGKIHLGFVYGHDRTHKTARTMIRGALSFAPLLRRWIGSSIERISVSLPFHYLVLRDSMLSVDEVEGYFLAVSGYLAEASAIRGTDYFGLDVCESSKRLTVAEADRSFDKRRVAAAFMTPEIAIDPEELADVVRAVLVAEPRVQLRMKCQVEAVQPDDMGLVVTSYADGIRQRERYEHVVNALWDGRLAVDATMGLRPDRPWTFRVKHYLRVSAPSIAGSIVPSAKMIHGPFGDVVNYKNGEHLLCWYPSGRRGISTDLAPPDWPLPPSPAVAQEIRDGIHAALSEIVWPVARMPDEAIVSSKVQGGIIFAWGSTDIDDPASGLHERHAIGVQSHGCYHTIDTGKYTLAPLFAAEAAGRVLGTE